MKEHIKRLALFLLPVILCTPAFLKSNRYQTAIESGYEIDAVVVDYDIETKSVEHAGEWDVYALYVDYEVDGKKYKNIKADESGEFYHRGDTIKVVVDPKNPGEIIHESDMFTGIMSIAGLLLGVLYIVCWISVKREHKKSKKESC